MNNNNRLHTPDSFWECVDKKGAIHPYNPEMGPCWVWVGARNQGYGWVGYHGKQETAHRVAYILSKGEIPNGLVVRHTCDNRPCCNPDHLLLGTVADNNRDMWERKRGKTPLTLDQAGERNLSAKLTAFQVSEIRERYANRKTTHTTLVALAIEYGVSQSCIHLIVTNQRWVDI